LYPLLPLIANDGFFDGYFSKMVLEPFYSCLRFRRQFITILINSIKNFNMSEVDKKWYVVRAISGKEKK
jgi:hypothetical protein